MDILKYCPKCGAEEFSSENGHLYICKLCDFEYYHNTASAVAGMIVCNSEILLVTRDKEPAMCKLDLPGGFVDHNETLENALTREVFEELGVEISNWLYFTSDYNSYTYRDVTYQTCVTFYCHQTQIKPQFKVDNSEISRCNWHSLASIDTTELSFPSIQRAVELLQYRQVRGQ